jgi:DNA-binding response OmpR family regulator
MNNLNSLKKVNADISVLYIEKNQKLQEKISQHLKQIFPTVYQATNGLDAMVIFNTIKPNIVMLDLALEKMDAIELIVDMQQLNPASNIIVLSEYNENFKLLESIDMGLYDMIKKPINLHKLNFTLKKLISTLVPKEVKPKVVVQPIKKEKQPIVKDIIKQKPIEQKVKTRQNIPSLNCVDILKQHLNKKVEMINTYKGVLLQNSCVVKYCEENMFKIEVPKTQLIASQYEKCTILKVDDKYIYSFVLKVDIANNMLTLVKPKFIEYKDRSKLYNRVVVDKSFKATIFLNNKIIEFDVKYISFNSTSLYTTNSDITVKIGDKLDLTLGFDLKSPSSIIKEKKFTKIFTKAEVMRIDKVSNGINIIVILDIQKSGQNIFKKYLQNREMEIITEFKKRLRI